MAIDKKKFVFSIVVISFILFCIFGLPKLLNTSYTPNPKNLLKYPTTGTSNEIFKTTQQNTLTDFTLITVPKDCNIIYIGVKGIINCSDLRNVSASIVPNSSSNYVNILTNIIESKSSNDFTRPIILKNQPINIQFTKLNIKVNKDDFFKLQLFSNGNKTISIENLYVEIEMSS